MQTEHTYTNIHIADEAFGASDRTPLVHKDLDSICTSNNNRYKCLLFPLPL